MVDEIRKQIPEIVSHIENGDNFLLSGGAGSGKTYTLMQVLDYIYAKKVNARVACITFTKVAVAEILSRAKHKTLFASTIHNFLWEVIKNYKKDLRKSVAELIEREKNKPKTGIKYYGKTILNATYFKQNNIDIEYRDYQNLEKGVISHDAILTLTNYMFEIYPLLRDILIDKYDYILVDEYQDTEKKVIDILLEYLPKSSKRNIIGFFGDSMQSIYSKRIGNLDEYKTKGLVKEFIKEDNWRCSKSVIKLLNKIRKSVDGIQQERKVKESEKGKNLEGSITFLYSYNDDIDITTLQQEHESLKEWNFIDFENTKELYLTHNLMSKKADFDKLYKIYNNDEIIKQVKRIKDIIKKNNEEYTDYEDKTFEELITGKFKPSSRNKNYEPFINSHKGLYDNIKNKTFEKLRKIYLDKKKLFKDDKDDLIKHLFKIQDCIYLYEKNKVNEFVKKTEYEINSISDKVKLRDAIEKLQNMKKDTIENVIDFAHNEKLIIKDKKLIDFINEQFYIYDRVKSVMYQQFVNLYNFEEDYTAFSTQHGVKGAEFNNVFVLLDDGKYPGYSFKNYFEQNTDKNLSNTERMFYVSCSRTKENLVVFYHKPTDKVLNRAKELFGEDNMKEYT